ncbi:UDP-glycosyltransferase UGT5-like [Condylostylus longicornis]|uniref:UDP-glycosyltransferase UGT5-like n=1 Tax=Condylostylus longicornis TaxID=2530218 RepID=UPI00244E18A0|nr:UDP-glycosyltransferase UGT5-like [Condylostylus longicornis]
MIIGLKIYFLLLIAVVAQYVESANILAVFVFPAKSHFMMTKVLVKELVKRGHKVTFVTSYSIPEVKVHKEILLDPPYNFGPDILETFNAQSLFDLTSLRTIDFAKMLEVIGTKTTEYALQNVEVQNLINNTETKGKFDLLLVEQFFQEAFLPLATKYEVPVISVATFGYANYISQIMGVITPYSHVPHGWLSYDDKMNFYERITNTALSVYDDFFREVIYFPQQDELVKKYYSHLKLNIPSVSKLEKNISLILLNSYIPLINPRPEVPGMIAVGGVHIEEPKPLPSDIKKFLDDGEKGVIYFNLGTNVRSADLPAEKLEMFLQIFRKYKDQKILWKWEDEKIPQLPANVMVKKWLPQNDILAHKNIKVFITHGGLMGTQEGVYHGVPMLGIPVYCDQYLNMRKAVKSNYAITLNYQTMTKNDIDQALEQLLHNPSYMENVKKFSEIFRDRPMKALDTSMYWIEYVIKYKGAPQLRSAGADMPWYQFYLLDVIGFFIIIIFSTLFSIVLLCKKLYSKKSNEKSKKEKITSSKSKKKN